MGEVLRFAIVGVAATLIQYGVYFVLVLWLNPTLAMTIAYAVSFAFNFVASTRYTFRVKASARRGAGFRCSRSICSSGWDCQSNGHPYRCLPYACQSTSCW